MVNANAGQYPSLNLSLHPVAACAAYPSLLFFDPQQPFVVRFDTTAGAPQPMFHYTVVQ